MIRIQNYIKAFPLAGRNSNPPWEITKTISDTLRGAISDLGSNFIVSDGVAIHESAVIEKGVVLKPPIIINANSFVGANSYLRGGVFLGEFVCIGPCCEIKSSVICSHSSIAHFNFIGDSLIGNYVNFEAGSVTANCLNDKSDKRIYVYYNSTIIQTGIDKFGSLVGDNSKIGANSVLSPGTILRANSIVGRLQLVDQQEMRDRSTEG